MLEEWQQLCISLSLKPADLWCGARKILRTQRATFSEIQPDLLLSHCGFTKSKLTILKKLYVHEESIAVAQEMWRGRIAKRKYGSVGFHCYNHLVKGGTVDAKRSKRASVMGPCIQAVNLTLLGKDTTHVDVYYRTTELYKKFPADLVLLRDELLPRFQIDRLSGITFHFANVTIHTMYAVTLLPTLEDSVAFLERLKRKDPHFYHWVVKWSARYLCDEHSRGIQKFSQALRVQKDMRDRLGDKRQNELASYFRKNHPGFRKAYDDKGAG